MQYKSISADGHVNEPPTLWVENLPEKFRDRGPHVIETPNTKGHAWIMEGQTRPSVDGLHLDVLPVVEALRPGVARRGLQADQGSRRPLRGPVPGLVRPGGAGRGDHRRRDRRRGHLQRRRHGVDRHQAVPRQGARARLLQGLQRLDRRLPGVRRPSGSSATARCRPPASTTASPSCTACADLGLRTVQLESYPSGVRRPSLRRTIGSGRRRSSSACRSTCTRSSSSRSATSARRSRPRVYPTASSAPRGSASTSQAGSFPVILWRMIQTGVFERFPDLKFVGTECTPVGFRTTSSASTSRCSATAATGTFRCCRASTSAATCRSCTSSTRSARTTATTSASPTSCGVPTSRTPRQLAGRLRARPRDPQARRCDASEIERIMWKNAADIYKVPYDEPATAAVAA